MKRPRLCGTRELPRLVDHTSGTITELFRHQAETLKRLHPNIEINYGPGPHSLDDVHIDITNKCNMSCPHCYQRCTTRTDQDIKLSTACNVIMQAKTLGGCRIALSGGEAIEHCDFSEIIRYIDDHGMVFTALFTNGKREDQRILTETKPWTMILVSYSPKMGQTCSIEWLKNIANNRKLTLSTITQTGEELDELYDLMASIRPYRWRVGICRPVGRGESVSVNIESSVMAYRRLFDRFISEYEDGKAPFELQLGFAFQSRFLKEKRIDLYPQDAKCCAYKSGSLVVKWDGRVTPCSMDENPIGDASNLAEAWEMVNSRSYRGLPSSSISACKDCDLKRWCNGGCRLCADDKLNGPDPIGCATYRFLKDIVPKLESLGVVINNGD